jgi:hypothetical protein
MNATRLPEKGTLESVVLGFDFSLEATSVSTPQFIVTAELGVDPSPGMILGGSPVADGAVVLQRVDGGLDGVTYRVSCTVSTLEGDTLTLQALLPVRVRL